MPDSVLQVIVFGLSAAIGTGLVFVWREDTWHRRVETLRAEFGRELRQRDDEIRRLNVRLDTLLELDEIERRHMIDRSRRLERERGGPTFNVGGDATIGGNVSGRDG